jgi:hypothetical protein
MNNAHVISYDHIAMLRFGIIVNVRERAVADCDSAAVKQGGGAALTTTSLVAGLGLNDIVPKQPPPPPDTVTGMEPVAEPHVLPVVAYTL